MALNSTWIFHVDSEISKGGCEEIGNRNRPVDLAGRILPLSHSFQQISTIHPSPSPSASSSTNTLWRRRLVPYVAANRASPSLRLRHQAHILISLSAMMSSVPKLMWMLSSLSSSAAAVSSSQVATTTLPYLGYNAGMQPLRLNHHLHYHHNCGIKSCSGKLAFAFTSPNQYQFYRRVRRRHHHRRGLLSIHTATVLEMSSSSSSSPPKRRQVSNTGNKGSSRSSSSSNSGGGGGNSNTGSTGRNRGANAASHNRRGHLLRISNKDGATATTTTSSAGGGRRSLTSSTSSSPSGKMNTKRPPRWEREGDRLYAEVTKDLNEVFLLASSNDERGSEEGDIQMGDIDVGNSIGRMKPTSAQDVCRLLEPWTGNTIDDDDNDVLESLIDDVQGNITSSLLTRKEEDEYRESNASPSSPSSPPFLWGSLPVGPVLASRLYATGRSEPTSVQRAAFSILTAAVSDNGNSKGNNNSYYSNTSGNDNSRRNRKMGYPTTSKRSSAIKKKAIIKRANAIIASPTGTGKTLAYLLPLLCTSPGGQRGEGTGGILIVTPTIELACQIQREVDVLWPPQSSSSSSSFSSLFVVGDGSISASNDDDDDNDEELDDARDNRWNRNQQEDDRNIIPPGRTILRTLIRHNSPPIIAGTPKMLRTLYREVGRIANGDYDINSKDNDDNIATISDEERTASLALCSNLRAIVMDESDRLLRTEAAAREATERKNRKLAQQQHERLLLLAEEDVRDDDGVRISPPLPPPLPSRKSSRLVIARQTQTEYLLRDLPIRSLDDVQIICASATVGRTMRRQLMQILDKPSADAAATLITGEEDVRVKSKDVERRRSALLPDRLKHAYRVVVENEGDGGRDEYMPVDNTDTTIESPDTSTMTVAERNEDIRVKQTIATLWDTMMSDDLTDAKPILIFPGRVGVDRVQKELMMLGLEDIRTLRNLDGRNGMKFASDDGSANSNNSDDISTTSESVMMETNNNDKRSNTKWKSIPIYIIGERFARGLDLPDVEYVFLLSPPSSAAGYAHMAGRTGRCGKAGVAFSLVRPRGAEVSRLAAIADTLGLRFDSKLSGGSAGGGG
jgi:superfamily II DNA/RNA helicase